MDSSDQKAIHSKIDNALERWIVDDLLTAGKHFERRNQRMDDARDHRADVHKQHLVSGAIWAARFHNRIGVRHKAAAKRYFIMLRDQS